MKGKYKIFYTLFCFIIILSLMGCSEKELPFTNSPENDIKIDYMEGIVQDQDKYEKLYMDYSSMKIAGVMSEELEQFIEDLKKNKSTEGAGKFADNGDKFIAFQMSLDDYKEDINKGAKTLVDNYLKYTRLGDKEATVFGLSPELEAQDPVGKVKQYMEKNNIKVTEIVFPEAFEEANYNLYPVKYTYRYILKGTVNNKPFEKEVVQDFYVGIDWSEGKDKIKDVIEYVRDVSE
ncbi:hypothetical protein [Clostridium thermosuccinogenes]|uniref:hypothetical protein n=1 Tax=Clostridium thermosuccinogenes TaxID=84032 RepID=UPI000CCC1E0F|nr:hypothetical protein [Pseudoclostridium thermosuccinogenes]PNT90339.1 hypothetical protein CDQ83_18890 [Pseudoclostridium thermosuccinogenes]